MDKKLSIPRQIKGFDVAAAVERMLGREDLWWEALGLFLQHYATWEKEWLAARGDDALECRLVHAMRSAAANVGASRLSCAAAVLEELLQINLNGRAVTIPSSVRWYLQDCWREVWREASRARLPVYAGMQ